MNTGYHVPGLVRLLKVHGLTQAELARRAGVHAHTIENLISGRHGAASVTLGKIARALGLRDTHALTQEARD
jgi:transcriptional regulator with XRE-family HTH domain